MKEAGIISGSDLSIASVIVKSEDFDDKSFAVYIGRGKKKAYCEWVCNYVKNH
jgi:hypothetical protein